MVCKRRARSLARRAEQSAEQASVHHYPFARGKRHSRIAVAEWRIHARLSEKPGAATAPTVPGNKSVSTLFQNG
jgi:hypothetical protein